MPGPRRSFSPEYRVEAAHLVIDGNRRVAEVARELNLHENLLHKWVRDEGRRTAAAGAGGRPDPAGGEPLSVDERAELGYDGLTLTVMVCSYADRISFSYLTGPDVMPDIEAVVPLTERCLAELETAVGVAR